MIVTGNSQLLKNINSIRIIRHLRTRPGISRSSLAEELGLSRSAVGNLVEELIADDWVSESPAIITGSSGRRATPLALNTSRRLLLGASINGFTSEVVALALNGEVRELTLGDAPGPPEAALDVLASQIVDFHRRLTEARFEISGIGVAVPGPVRPESGVLHHSDSLGWKEVPVQAMLEERLRKLGLPDIPLVIQRAVACMAIKHFEFEYVDREQPLLYVHVGRSIAAAAVSNSDVVWGYHGLAGSCAHLNIEPDGPLCECGKRGCANSVLTLRAMEIMLDTDAGSLKVRAGRQDPEVLAVMRAVGEKLGTFIFNLSLQYDPARLFVGGPAFQLGGEYVRSAQQQLNALAAAAGIQPPPLQVMRYERQNVAIGAATTVLHQLLQRHGKET